MLRAVSDQLIQKDCLGRHIPAKTDDWIYVKGYPVLPGN